MRFVRTILVGLPVLAIALTEVADASACGGCFPPLVDVSIAKNTQVSGHRMVLSIGKTQTTLWDQISYVGSPESFAWVLPIKGMVDVGVSSDALFGALEQLTAVTINPPLLDCGASYCVPPSPDDSPTDLGGGGPGVTVIAQKVVGPYETAQLASTDPLALKKWLTDHGYDVSPEIEPIISTYITEGFDFLALKLVPGQDVQSMKPVRVTTAGASPILPLRMVAAGAGASVPLTLFIVGEGKYLPSNFPSFTIPANKLVWNWDTNDSNYKSLRQDGFANTDSRGWIVEAGEPVSQSALLSPLLTLVNYAPDQSGYGDATGKGALEECEADIQALVGAIPPSTLNLTRLHAELPKSALATDLTVEAASDQTPVQRVFNITQTVGKVPACPPDPCGGLGTNPGPKPAGDDKESSGCAVVESGSADASLSLFSALLSAGLFIARKRTSPVRRTFAPTKTSGKSPT